MPYNELGKWEDCACLRFNDRDCKCPCHTPLNRQHEKFLSVDEHFVLGYDQATREVISEICEAWKGEPEELLILTEHLRHKFNVKI